MKKVYVVYYEGLNIGKAIKVFIEEVDAAMYARQYSGLKIIEKTLI